MSTTTLSSISKLCRFAPLLMTPLILAVMVLTWTIVSKSVVGFAPLLICALPVAIINLYWYQFTPPRLVMSALVQLSTAFALSTWFMAPFVSLLQFALAVALYHSFNFFPPTPPNPSSTETVIAIAIWGILSPLIEMVLFSLLAHFNLKPNPHPLYESDIAFQHIPVSPPRRVLPSATTNPQPAMNTAPNPFIQPTFAMQSPVHLFHIPPYQPRLTADGLLSIPDSLTLTPDDGDVTDLGTLSQQQQYLSTVQQYHDQSQTVPHQNALSTTSEATAAVTTPSRSHPADQQMDTVGADDESTEAVHITHLDMIDDDEIIVSSPGDNNDQFLVTKPSMDEMHEEGKMGDCIDQKSQGHSHHHPRRHHHYHHLAPSQHPPSTLYPTARKHNHKSTSPPPLALTDFLTTPLSNHPQQNPQSTPTPDSMSMAPLYIPKFTPMSTLFRPLPTETNILRMNTTSSSSSSSAQQHPNLTADPFASLSPSAAESYREENISTNDNQVATTASIQSSQHRQDQNKPPPPAILPLQTTNLPLQTTTGNDFVHITPTETQPVFQLFQIEHPNYKGRLLATVLGFSTSLLLFRLIAGAIWIGSHPHHLPPTTNMWSLAAALAIVLIPLSMVIYHLMMVVFAAYFYDYFPYNNHTNRNITESSKRERFISSITNQLFPLLNDIVLTGVNALVITNQILPHSSWPAVKFPIFLGFNLLFVIYMTFVLIRLELSSLSINFHCTGSLTHPTPKELNEYLPLLLISHPPTSLTTHNQSQLNEVNGSTTTTTTTAGNNNISTRDPQRLEHTSVARDEVDDSPANYDWDINDLRGIPVF